MSSFSDVMDFVLLADGLSIIKCFISVVTSFTNFFSGRMTDSIAEILNGLHCYFDKALPLMLLYKNERQQYHDVVTSNISPSIVYGAKHLLRLFGMLLMTVFSW